MVDYILDNLRERFSFNKLDVIRLNLSTETVDKWACVGWWFAGACVGWFAWGGSSEIWPLSGLLILPIGWGMARSRASAGLLMLGYYLASARGLPGGIGVFFGDSAPWWSGWVLWATTNAFLAVPFFVLWSERIGSRPWRFVLAVCVSIAPPLAFIGWVNPLAMAGVLFPGLGWAGLALCMGLFAALVARSGRQIVWLAVVVLVANLAALARDVAAPVGWLGVDTMFSRLGSGGSGDASVAVATMARVEWMKGFLDSVPAHSVRVLPETILGSYGPVAAWKLEAAIERLSARGSRVLVGAELYTDGDAYKNAVVVLGARDGEDVEAVEGIPVPISMWKPWASDGAVANVWGRGASVEVLGKRASVLVCYEQFLMFTMLKAMVNKPDVLVGVANVWWIRDASMPVVQVQMMESFGRLFGVPVVRARNF